MRVVLREGEREREGEWEGLSADQQRLEKFVVSGSGKRER